jgi:RNA polymerase sigma-70 factor (ECF subfamily)
MEAQIIQRCKDGDLDAFENIYKQYGDRIFGLCLRMSKSRETAEDLVQEVFILLIRKIKSFRGESKFSTWLYRISVNTCLSYLRKQQTKKETTEGFDAAAALQKASSPDVVHREALKKAIAELPEGYRASVVLHDIQGYSHKEIGTMLGISDGASKSQLFKARRKLREVVAAWDKAAVAGSVSR